MPSQDDFQKALNEFFNECERKGFSNVNLTARELYHLTCSESPKGNHCVPNCCKAMYRNMNDEVDQLIYQPPKGYGTRLEIRYFFPRRQSIVDNSDWHCPICGGSKFKFITIEEQPRIWDQATIKKVTYRVCITTLGCPHKEQVNIENYPIL